jgi:hypothetical protein
VEGGQGGLAGCGMWRGGGRPPTPVDRGRGRGRQRPGGTGAGERHEYGGGPVQGNGRWLAQGKEKEKMGLAQGNNATFKLFKNSKMGFN